MYNSYSNNNDNNDNITIVIIIIVCSDPISALRGTDSRASRVPAEAPAGAFLVLLLLCALLVW